MPDVLPGAEPFSAAGGRCGALVLHGFTGSPQSMRPLAQAFADAGYAVELPLLPGHGTTVADMAGYGWPDWTAAVEQAYQQLSARCSTVMVAGLSMGGSLALWLASEHPGLAGLVLVNPVAETGDLTVTELAYTSVPNRSALSLIEGLGALKERLAGITVPALVLHSTQDHIVPPGSAALLSARLGGPVEVVELEHSFHVATIDLDGDLINASAVAFAAKVTGIR
jgi:carboxylesterase